MLAGVEIRGHKGTGIWVTRASVTARDCKIRKNAGAGVDVSEGGTGTFEKCDLSGNVEGAWKLEDPTKVVRKGNTPAR